MDIDNEWVRENWPFIIGAGIIVVGNIYLYVWGSGEWVPGGPPLLLAVVVVLFIEVARTLYRRYD